ncbi:hypothetical protein E2C01_014233 [Portunus trituberculatus]|uniref:Uncharacterized protein n=1 Tax=Portunus trituberculatus TaxID=210409 RepID=A0A5B7DJV8_PORTR|nr:hypothetical protein [Portunus trituberculatus]
MFGLLKETRDWEEEEEKGERGNIVLSRVLRKCDSDEGGFEGGRGGGGGNTHRQEKLVEAQSSPGGGQLLLEGCGAPGGFMRSSA